MLTRTFSAVRVHANASIGTWNVKVQNPIFGCGPNQVAPPGTSCPFVPVPFIPDTPCLVDEVPNAMATARCGAPAVGEAVQQLELFRTRYGRRWFGGVAVDHAFAVHSVLLAGDVYVEHFEQLYARPDVGAEVGVRRQLSPIVVVDAGVGRRFAGPNRATLVTAGATVTAAVRPLVR